MKMGQKHQQSKRNGGERIRDSLNMLYKLPSIQNNDVAWIKILYTKIRLTQTRNGDKD